jgi:hypothetical protein
MEKELHEMKLRIVTEEVSRAQKEKINGASHVKVLPPFIWFAVSVNALFFRLLLYCLSIFYSDK